MRRRKSKKERGEGREEEVERNEHLEVMGLDHTGNVIFPSSYTQIADRQNFS